jgi:hypothetical protein
MIQQWLVILRKAVENRSYIISSHATRRMGEREITVADLEACLTVGEFIEDQDHGENVKALLRGTDCKSQEFYTVVALAFPRPVIVTVCRFQKDAWEDMGPFKKRI